MSDDFATLSRGLQITVDEAFDAALESNRAVGLSPIKKRSSKATAACAWELAGGFDVESDDDSGGGFVPSNGDERERLDSDVIPLPLVPSALQLLDLPPDDEEVLQVFRSAAGGWSAAPRSEGVFDVGERDSGRAVTRKDWRAVCAVIVSDRKEEHVAAGGFLVGEERRALGGARENSLREGEAEGENIEDEDEDEEEGEDGDEAYDASSPSSLSYHASDSDSDEYTGEPSSSKPKPRDRKPKHKPAPSAYGTPTARQTRASLDAFALFFPAAAPLTDADLATKRLMFKDIVRVADMLKEKIKAEEVEEMLTLFSTSPDKSISFDDFTRMMIVAKLAWCASI